MTKRRHRLDAQKGSPVTTTRVPAPLNFHGQLVEELGRRIAAGDLSPGTQLMPEEIAESHGVGRGVVREALRVLEAKGMVSARPRTGTRVREPKEWNLLDQSVILWTMTGPDWDRQLHELLELRAAVEPIAARSCAAINQSTNAASLRQACEAMAQAVRESDRAAFMEADISFHSMLLLGSENRIFTQLSDAIEAALRAREALELLPDKLTDLVCASHRRVAEAIASGDGATAETAMREILQQASGEIFGHAEAVS